MKHTLKKLALCVLFSIGTFNASATSQIVKIDSIQLERGGNSIIKWLAPTAETLKVFVYVPVGGTATNASYRVYPQGRAATTTSDPSSLPCVSTATTYPCFEFFVNQAINQGKWLQLMRNNDAKTAWAFTKTTGYVMVGGNNLNTTEWLSATTVRFDTLATTPVVYPTTGYSKISNAGALVVDATLLGSTATQWACTRDNVSGLIWEIKTDDGGLRDKDNTYSWYNPNSATNGGSAGYQNYGTCTGGISCDTEGYVTAVNAAKLCGFNDWRMPTKKELLVIVNKTYTPTINPTYFPNTQSDLFWSSSPSASYSDFAWIVNFYLGYDYGGGKNDFNAVRLVRGGQ